MSKLPALLIVGGIAVGAITYFGSQMANKKSSEQVLMESLVKPQQVEKLSEEEVAELRVLVLEVPTECADVSAAPFYSICDSEAVDDWSTGLSDAERGCLLATFHSTNTHANKMRSKDYTPEEPSFISMNGLVCDIAGYTYKLDIEWGDNNAPASNLISAFHQARAEETGFIPPRSY